MALEIRAFIAANDSRLKSKEIMLLTSLCLLLNIDGLVEELGLWPGLAGSIELTARVTAALDGIEPARQLGDAIGNGDNTLADDFLFTLFALALLLGGLFGALDQSLGPTTRATAAKAQRLSPTSGSNAATDG